MAPIDLLITVEVVDLAAFIALVMLSSLGLGVLIGRSVKD